MVSIGSFFDIPEFTLSASLYYNIWFCLGCFICNNKDVMQHNLLKHYPIYISIFSTSYVLCLCCGSDNYLIRGYVLPFLGCIFIWTLCLRIPHVPFLVHLGKYSMQYYTIHLLICFVFFHFAKYVYNLTDSYFGALLISYFTLILTTYLILNIVKKIKRFNPLFGL